MTPQSARRTFALIGAAGYVAPRHLRAIRDVGGDLKAALDPSDSVGVLDSYFPDAHFFVQFERFDRHIDKLSRQGTNIDYISVCSPNHLHDAHVRFAMRSGVDAICEKPLVLNPSNVDALAKIEETTGQRVFTIMQLRLHPTVVALREKIENGEPDRIYDVDLTYIASRGRWYFVSWKGDDEKSGGIATNIGVHFYDLLSFLFGRVNENILHYRTAERAAGYLEYDKARVRWFLSVDGNDLPAGSSPGSTSFRSITVDGEQIEFSGGFTDLHTLSYQEILKGNGFSVDDVRPSIETVAAIRTAPVEPGKGSRHPFLDGILDGSRKCHA